MKKTVQVNIGGCAFNIDEDSYSVIQDYLGTLQRYYADTVDGKEIVEDIEERMAELLLERCGTGNVVSGADARYVIGVLGTPATFAEETKASDKGAEKPTKRLYRNPEGQVFGGVCSGLATYLNCDVTLIRLIGVILFLATLPTGTWVIAMPLLYSICWLAMPLADTVQKQCELRGEHVSAAGIEQKIKSGKDIPVRPAGKTFGRVLGVILGIILFLSGLSALCGGAIAFSLPSLLHVNPDIAEWWGDMLEEIGIESLNPIGISTWIVAAIVYALPCIIAIYYGILLTFNLRSPKWRPGLIMVVIWAISLVVLCVLVGIDIIKLVQINL